MKKKTDSSKSCTEFIVAFVSVNFLKKHILEMEAKYVCWGQRGGALTVVLVVLKAWPLENLMSYWVTWTLSKWISSGSILRW